MGEDSVKKLNCVKLQWSDVNENGQRQFREMVNSEFELNADLVLLAMGFVHVEHGPLVKDLNLKTDDRGNLLVNSQFMTSVPGVFAGGDSIRGASLVVHAIYQGRQAAEYVDQYLTNL